MLFGFLVGDKVAAKSHIYVLARCMLHTVSVEDDSEFFVAAFDTVRLDLFWRFVKKHCDGRSVTTDLCAVCEFSGDGGLCGTDTGDV